MPVSIRSGIRSASESTAVYEMTLTPAMRPPVTTRSLRPRRSPIRPAIGWLKRSIGLTAADGERDAEASHPELVVGIDGNHGKQHPDRQAQRELGDDGENERPRQDTVQLHRSIQADRMETPSRQERRSPTRTQARVATEARQRSEARREAAPAAVAVLVVFAVLAVVMPDGGLGAPRACRGGSGSSSASRRFCSSSISWLAPWPLGSSGRAVAALVLLVAPREQGTSPRSRFSSQRLVTTSTSDLSGGELLLTGFAIYATDVIVFGLLFWELESGGPFVRGVEDERDDARVPLPPGRRPASRPIGDRRCGTTCTCR